jgi:transcriptional regulator with XRE-family HTH domain
MNKTLFDEYLESPDNMRCFQQERAIYEVTELIEKLMANLGVTRTQLASKLGQSKAWVTQLLDGEKNKTIRTVADVFAVLGHEFHGSCKPIQIASKLPATASITITPSLEKKHTIVTGTSTKTRPMLEVSAGAQ